jgi:hypothetical protein
MPPLCAQGERAAGAEKLREVGIQVLVNPVGHTVNWIQRRHLPSTPQCVQPEDRLGVVPPLGAPAPLLGVPAKGKHEELVHPGLQISKPRPEPRCRRHALPPPLCPAAPPSLSAALPRPPHRDLTAPHHYNPRRLPDRINFSRPSGAPRDYRADSLPGPTISPPVDNPADFHC